MRAPTTHQLLTKFLLILLKIATGLVIFGMGILADKINAQEVEIYRIFVSSDRDFPIKPDTELTLREAISLVNNSLNYEQLSPAEKQQVIVINSTTQSDRTEQFSTGVSRIEFTSNTPTTIKLQTLLPPILNPLIIDGTTHPSYDPNSSQTAEIDIPTPVVTLTPEPGNKIYRGLTIASSNITVKGLSIYGFSQPPLLTDGAGGGDIVIDSRLRTLDQLSLSGKKLEAAEQHPLENVAIIDNWLGLAPDESFQAINSTFGIWLFDGVKTKIQRNRIYYHGGSGILTLDAVENTQIQENIIVGNGLTGMSHGIYLNGTIDQSQVTDNLICGNGGSGIYLFKPEGAINISQNQIKFNGRRIASAAIYLMGNNHRVTKNQISWQTGGGVVVSAFDQSQRNIITDNSFSNLEGLSIDLNTRNHFGHPFFNLGDGINNPRVSRNRLRDTANKAINSPQFLSDKFYILDGKVNIDGVADPNSRITLYEVKSDFTSQEKPQNYGTLTKPLTNTTADDRGKFSFTLQNLNSGTIISAIATIPEAGTSEPAGNAVILSLSASQTNPSPGIIEETTTNYPPNCTTKPVVQTQQSQPIPAPPPQRQLSLNVPRSIHFALDKAHISAASAKVLDRIIKVLNQYPFLVVELRGHTDSRADENYNLALSQYRAIATRNYLLQKGIQPARITIRPLGESQLKMPGNSALEHAHNRRVEIEFYDLQGIEIIFEEQQEDLQLEKTNP